MRWQKVKFSYKATLAAVSRYITNLIRDIYNPILECDFGEGPVIIESGTPLKIIISCAICWQYFIYHSKVVIDKNIGIAITLRSS